MHLVLTLLGPDKPGLVDSLAAAINSHGANWLDSRMAHMAGHFAGLLKIDCPEDQVEELTASLHALSEKGLTIQVATENTPHLVAGKKLKIDIVGHDQPGIVRRLASAISAAGANVEELDTCLEAAPMSGHPQFHAVGSISIPDDFDTSELSEALEKLGADLSVEITR